MVKNGWPVFASMSWAMVMYIFRWHPEVVQSSLRSSMSYMWVFLCNGGDKFANMLAATYNRMNGIHYGRCCGITSEWEKGDGSTARGITSVFEVTAGELACTQTRKFSLGI